MKSKKLSWRRELRQSGNEREKQEAVLCLDWGGTGTQLRTDTIIVIQSALEPCQVCDAQLEALGEMKRRGVWRSTKLQCWLEHERGEGDKIKQHSANNEINKSEAASVDDSPDGKYLLCLFHYSVSVKASMGATVTVSAVLAVRSMVLKRCIEGTHSRDAFCWLAHWAADATRGRH